MPVLIVFSILLLLFLWVLVIEPLVRFLLYGQKQYPLDFFVRVVRFYRPLGFFETPRIIPDKVLAIRLRLEFDKWMGPDCDLSSVAEEIACLRKFSIRIFPDVRLEPNFQDESYGYLLRSLAEISNFAFGLDDVIENSTNGETVTEVIFKLGEQSHTFKLAPYRKSLDFSILNLVNEIMPDTGPKFEFLEGGDYFPWIVAVKREEKTQLERRGWKFVQWDDWKHRLLELEKDQESREAV